MPRYFFKITTFVILFLYGREGSAQDLSGVWTGRIEITGSHFVFELAINDNKGNITGYALTVFLFNGIENMGIKTVKLKNRNGNISLEDGEMVYDNYSTPPKKVKLIGNLFLKGKDSTMTLTGSFFTRSLDLRERDKEGFSGTIYLKKQPVLSTTRLIAKLDEIQLLNTLAFATPRKEGKEQPLPVAAAGAEEIQLPAVKDRVNSFSPDEMNVTAKPPVLQAQTREKIARPPEVLQEPADEPVQLTKDIQTSMTTAPRRPEKADLKPVDSAGSKAVRVVPPDLSSHQADKAGLPAAAALLQRKTEVIREVEFVTDSLLLTLYDNGTVDGDTVSVVLEGKVIVARKGLTTTAIRTTVYLTPDLGDTFQLVMYAENLGTIPPNTGLLIVQDGQYRHEIRFAGDMQKSSAILLKRKR